MPLTALARSGKSSRMPDSRRIKSQNNPNNAISPTPTWLLATALSGLALLAFAAYSNIFSVPFFFDDGPAILNNPTLHHLWTGFNQPPSGGTIDRPVANFSFALNYAISGTSVWSYHLANLAIHVFAGLTLFGIVRRTFLQPRMRDRFGAAAFPLAFVIAGIWLAHPLLTESVTCTVQRTESLVSLFYLLTLYCFVRSTEGARTPNAERRTPNAEYQVPATRGAKRSAFSFQSSAFWQAASLAACLLGMASKETMATAPVVVLLYDRTFVAGSFREAWRQHKWTHLLLAATWLLLGAIKWHSGWSRGKAAGFDLGVSWYDYALTQCKAVVRYLYLAFWPHSLVMDYGTGVTRNFSEVWAQATFLLVLLAATVVALVRWPKIGFLAAWIFVILAPSSSFLPLVTQTMAEHRMYLPLAAIVAGVSTGIYLLAKKGGLWTLGLIMVGLAVPTYQRNQAYQTEVGIWEDTLRKYPENIRARNEYANSLEALGEHAEAIAQYQESIREDPTEPYAHYNLGRLLLSANNAKDAIAQFHETVRLKPEFAPGHSELGNALIESGKFDEGIRECQEALRLQPDLGPAYFHIGVAYFQQKQYDKAIDPFTKAVQLNPDFADAHNDLGSALFMSGHKAEAIEQYQLAVSLNPNDEEAQKNLKIAVSPTPPAAK